VIGLAREQRARLLLGDEGFGAGQLAVEVGEQLVALLRVGLFGGERNVGVDVAGDGGEARVGVDLIFGAFAVAQDGLCGFLIVPEIGLGNFGFERGQFLAVLRGVKENSGRERCEVSGFRSDIEDLRESCRHLGRRVGRFYGEKFKNGWRRKVASTIGRCDPTL
jgi:hypothetical protein